MSNTQNTVAKARKAKNPAFGVIVQILGVDYTQKGTLADALELVDQINKACLGMTEKEVRARYKLGN